ncbi:tripartite tricarboxylate transporter family receptor [Variibacter gotjawalensis]|uniref:Tripartite tricarboxylate transporter family receptor n=1 Tax=Variibacter gotjawalensis TaxID=1333996 RepID=A0A0S3PT77_9BRAD|nr:putative tricarboxylic transport membrane protein [Variibacter gotjawalensis]BAT59024.1 tripartite tricarboxylate transporter family receptor [Variibacter gotjawalensis]
MQGSAGVAALAALGSRADAQALEQLQLFVPAAPGGGWDQTARTMELVLKHENLIKNSQITNVGGAGGAVGLPQFVNQWKNRPNALMVAGLVMVGALIANKAPVKITQTQPVARLTGEAEVLVVPANSPIKTAKDFGEALKADPKKVSVAGGSAGGTDHILLGLIGKALGVAPKSLNYVAYAGGGPAIAAILGGHVTGGISGYGEFGEQIKAGKVRALAVSSAERQPGIDVPTLKEQGIDVELSNWRGVFAPPGASKETRDALIKLMDQMMKTATWKTETEKREWSSIPLFGDDYGKFLDGEIARVESVLKDIGLAG